ncbi:MAG: hypothetical protein JWL83_1631 [Actinomycetia bacterium]|nr:hypothetical protein [Actinomycetes bacterium]
MLTRLAESLYWFGRYVERAEDTARILDVHYHLLLEDPWVDESAACRALLEVMGVECGEADTCDIDTVTRALAYDASYGGSIVGSMSAAWHNARGAREVISSEIWECVNATHIEIASRASASVPQPHKFFIWVKERAAILAGLADSTMSRDDAWRYLVLGRSLERVDMTARLLSSRHQAVWGDGGWTTTLRCCSAYESYLRTYQRAVDATLAAQFLLLDRLFPRSVLWALRTAEQCLAELDPSSSRVGFDDVARRTLGRARTELEFRALDDLLGSLPDHLAQLQNQCTAAAGAVADRYFRHTRPLEWTA